MLSDNKVIKIFYMADDFCNFFNETVKKHSIDDGKKHRNKPSRLSDSEIMTILIMFHMSGFRCLKHSAALHHLPILCHPFRVIFSIK